MLDDKTWIAVPVFEFRGDLANVVIVFSHLDEVVVIVFLSDASAFRLVFLDVEGLYDHSVAVRFVSVDGCVCFH